jgi:hypothetical protein
MVKDKTKAQTQTILNTRISIINYIHEFQLCILFPALKAKTSPYKICVIIMNKALDI